MKIQNPAKFNQLSFGYLGGSGYIFATNEPLSICFAKNSVIVKGVSSSAEIHPVEISEFKIYGPGNVVEGGGFGGGGFGVEGAVIGIATALLLNTLTTTSGIHTYIQISTRLGEIFLHNTQIEPELMRVLFSRLYAEINYFGVIDRKNPIESADKAEELGFISSLEKREVVAALNKPKIEASFGDLGYLIKNVSEPSNAHHAGIKVGDVILTINNQGFSNDSEFGAALTHPTPSRPHAIVLRGDTLVYVALSPGKLGVLGEFVGNV